MAVPIKRKRQRQPCLCTGNIHASSQRSSASKFKCHRHQYTIISSSWKMTVATFLLLLCGDHLQHTGRSTSSPTSTTMIQAYSWDSSSSSSSSSTNNSNVVVQTQKKGLQLVRSCTGKDFDVQAVYLVCDSPGAYYRGSSSYRDSTTCIYGDKARLQLQCEFYWLCFCLLHYLVGWLNVEY